jgi:hypothetical protein
LEPEQRLERSVEPGPAVLADIETIALKDGVQIAARGALLR